MLDPSGIMEYISFSKEGRIRGKVQDYFTDWNYKKHAKLCCGVYLALFALDMTVGYVIAKKVLPKKLEE